MVQAAVQDHVPAANGEVQSSSAAQQADAQLSVVEQETIGPLLAQADFVQSSGGSRQRAGACSSAIDLASGPQGTAPANVRSQGFCSPTPPATSQQHTQDAEMSPGATHAPRRHNLPVNAATNVDRVEEWLSFSLSGSHRSPTSSPRSDQDPLPPGASADAELFRVPGAAESQPLPATEPGSFPVNSQSHRTSQQSQQQPDAGAHRRPIRQVASANSRPRDEVSAVPDEVLSAIQHIAGVSAVRRDSRSSSTSGCLLSMTAPASISSHMLSAAPSQRVPLGEPAGVYGTGHRGSAPLAPLPDSPTASSATVDNPGSAPPNSTPPEPRAVSPAPSFSGSASAPSRIVLDGVLSMLHNRPAEPVVSSSPPSPIPDALSAALAKLHAHTASLETTSRGAPNRSLSHGATPHGAVLNQPSARTLRRPQSMHATSGHFEDEHATTYPPEQRQRRTQPRLNGSASASHIGSSPQAALSSPLIVPTGLPGGTAMKMRVEQLFFAADDDGSPGLHPDPMLDMSQDTQVTQEECSRSSGFVPPSLGVLEQPEADTLSSSSNNSVATPLQLHAGAGTRPYSGAPKPGAEDSRMRRLCELNVLETAPEARYDRITALVAQVFSMPIVLVSLVDSDRQWFKSVAGLPGISETSRDLSFCAWTLLPQDPECLVVSDARNDARFRNNPLVTSAPFLQFYAGCPLVSSSGQRLGSLCAIDNCTRYFTAEDCNLLCNLAEIVVRELETLDAQEQKMFDAGAAATERLRPAEAWDIGLLVLHIGHNSWRIRHANERAGEVLGVTDLSSFIGTDFWDFFSLKDPPPGSHPSARFRLQLMEGQDLTFDTKVFTDEGQKLWISCTMRSGTQSQVDDNCPLVSVPMDLVSEPGTKAGYWFVSIKPMVDTPSRFARVTTHGPMGHTHSSHECNTHLFDTPELNGILLLTQLAVLPHSHLHTCLHAPHASDCGDAPTPEDICTTGEWQVTEIMLTEDPQQLWGCMHTVNASWSAAGLVHGVHALTDITRTVAGHGALMLLRSVPHTINMSLRSAIHEGVFKKVPTPDEIYNGVVRVDVRLAISSALHLAHSLTLLHASSLVHGHLSDASVLVSMAHHRSKPDEHLILGDNLSVCFATLGVPLSSSSPTAHSSSAGGPGTGLPQGYPLMDPSQDGAQTDPHSSDAGEDMLPPLYLDDIAAARSDLPLFYAPERFDHNGKLVEPAEAAADVWSLGMVLAYMLRVSLPLLKEGPLTLHQKARQGTLLEDVVQMEEATCPPEATTLISLCLSSTPHSRPSAARCAAALEHIHQTLSEEPSTSAATPSANAP